MSCFSSGTLASQHTATRWWQHSYMPSDKKKGVSIFLPASVLTAAMPLPASNWLSFCSFAVEAVGSPPKALASAYLAPAHRSGAVAANRGFEYSVTWTVATSILRPACVLDTA